MKKLKLLMALGMMLLGAGLNPAKADHVTIDGINYNLTSSGGEVLPLTDGGKYTGDVVIPSSVEYNSEIYQIKRIYQGAFKNCTDLSSITFPETLASIYTDAFNGCIGLTTITLPENVFVLGDNAFKDCSGLKSITVWAKDPIEIPDNAFEGVSKDIPLYVPGSSRSLYRAADVWKEFTNIQPIPGTENEIYGVYDEESTKLTLYYDDQRETRNGRTNWRIYISNITVVILDESMKNARPTSTERWFANANSLTEIKHLDYLNTSEVTDMSSMFYDCAALTELDVHSFDTRKVTDMTQMFCACIGLTSLDVRRFNTANVITFDRMFQQCRALTSLDVSYFDTHNATDLSEMFKGCKELTTLYMNDCAISGATDVSYMFYGCNKLTTIYCNNDWTSSTAESTSMFADCFALVGGNGTPFDKDGYMNLRYARPDDPENGKPGYFTHYEPKTEVYAVADGRKMVLYYDNLKRTRENVIFEWTEENGTHEMSWDDMRSYTSVELDASMQTARPTSLKFWFYSMGNVTEIVHLDYLNTSEVTDMSYLFSSCGVRTLDLSTFNTDKVTTMRSMFNQCGVVELNISSFNTSNVTDMSYMFSSGWQLTELDITHFNTERVLDMSYMFHQSNIKVLDLRNFSVAQNPSMTAMFERASTTTIICDQDWSQTTGWDSWMFEDSKSLEGGQGTKWSSENPTDKTYARPDDPENGKPGYFTTTEDLTRRWIYAVQDGTKMVLYYDNQKRTRENVIVNWTPEQGANNMTDEERAAITSVELDASMQAARPTSTYCWFQWLNNLTSIEGLAYLNTSEVTNMAGMLYGCSSLTSLDVSNFNTGKVTDMSYMFNGCSSLTSLDVSNFNTANVTDMNGMFYGCSSLTSLDLSSFNTANVTNTAIMFQGCSSLTTIICEDDWSASTVLKNSENMFAGCTALKGGKGTAFDAEHVDAAYARPDGLDDAPGYFTSEEDTDWPCGVGEYAYSVDVIEPGTFAILMVDAMGAQTWTEVKSLCVSGNLNADDQAWLAKLPNIQYLNLRHTNITEFGECANYKSLEKIVLPKTCKTLKKNAFYRCEKLTSINLKNVENIGEEAFCYCSLLPSESLDLRNAKWVNHRAFEYCKALTTVSLPKATYVGTQCFVGCEELTSIVVPNLQKVGGSAFAYNTKLTYAYIGDVLEKMEGSEFYGCKALKSLHLPAALRYLGSSSVGGIEGLDGDWPKYLNHVGNGNFTNLTSVVIGPYITYWYALSDKWTDIYCYAIDPATVLSEYEHVFNDNKVANMTLHVPAASVASYKLNANYSKFGHIVPMDDIIYDLNVNSDFQLLKTDNISEHANLDLKEGAGMTTSASGTLNLGSYHQIVTCVDKYHRSEGSGDNIKYYAHLYRTGVLCANSPVYSDEVMVSLVPRHKAWSFFSLPFDVNMQDITISTIGKGKYAYGEGVEGVSQWVIREYSCENRASGEGATWNNVSADGVLKAHTGYILYWLVEGGTNNSNDYPSGGLTDEFLYVFNMPAMHTDNLQDIFETGDAIVPLTHYSSEFPQNRNWNFIGNPYPCAFNIRETNLDAPITIWKDKGYTAYSPIDDPFILRPAEAFFVQAPDAMDAITFYKEGRYPSTKIEIDENSYQLKLVPSRERAGERTLYNFLLSSDTYTDRARLVLNEEASMAYELNRDASKMMSSDNSVPQIWMENDGIRYAINEQPESEAYTMGALFGQAGEYTLNVQSGDAQHTILLTDKVENKTVDLTEGAYTFSTKAGEYEGRFLVQFGHKMPTGMERIESSANSYQKVIVNGQLILITPEGKRYTANGVEF